MKKIIAVFILFVICFSAVSCNQASEDENSVLIYSIKENTEELYIRKLPCEERSVSELINLVMDELKRSEKGKFFSVFDNMDVSLSWNFDNGKLYVEGLYYDIFASTRTSSFDYLCKAAFTNSLLSIDGVDYVEIVDKDEDGNYRNIMEFNDQSFITDASNDTEVRYLVDLFYPDINRESLHKITKAIPYYPSEPIYISVLKALQQDPEQDDLIPSIPKDVDVTDVTIDTYYCNVNFTSSQSFSNMNIPGILIGRSIINSLTSLEQIECVCISLDGEDNILTGCFDPNYYYFYFDIQ